MFERFTRQARQVVQEAEVQARALGERQIEAEHLLLALARGAGTGPRAATDGVEALLAEAGLDVTALLDALDAEQTRSLAAVGIDPSAFVLPDPARRRHAGGLRFGASAKAAMAGSVQAALTRHDRHIGEAHLLLGVLAAEQGRVPRTLELAGVDRAELAAAV